MFCKYVTATVFTFNKYFIKGLLQKPKISKHHQAQYDAIVTEHDKVMLFDVTHQEPDDQDADYKCYYAAHCQDQ